MPRLTSQEADDLFSKAALFIEACDDSLNEAQALITEIVDTVDWESFSPDQRISLKQWHLGAREARHALRNNHV